MENKNKLQLKYIKTRIILPLSIMILLIVFFFVYKYIIRTDSISEIYIFSTAIMVSALFYKSYLNYLDGKTKSKNDTEMREELLGEVISTLKEEIKVLNDKVKINSLNISDSDDNRISSYIQNSVKDKINSALIETIESKYSDKLLNNSIGIEIKENIDQTILRLKVEIDNLTRRLNSNLVIGTLATLIAGAALLLFAYNSPQHNSSSNDNYLLIMVSYFVPRLSVVIFIEIFAYFFLRLYKVGLSDIKYYQNELTTIESKYVALICSFFGEEKENLQVVISEIAKTDRNYSWNTFNNVSNNGNSIVKDKDTVDIITKVLEIIKTK